MRDAHPISRYPYFGRNESEARTPIIGPSTYGERQPADGIHSTSLPRTTRDTHPVSRNPWQVPPQQFGPHFAPVESEATTQIPWSTTYGGPQPADGHNAQGKDSNQLPHAVGYSYFFSRYPLALPHEQLGGPAQFGTHVARDDSEATTQIPRPTTWAQQPRGGQGDGPNHHRPYLATPYATPQAEVDTELLERQLQQSRTQTQGLRTQVRVFQSALNATGARLAASEAWRNYEDATQRAGYTVGYSTCFCERCMAPNAGAAAWDDEDEGTWW